jgi:hypothetical protein
VCVLQQLSTSLRLLRLTRIARVFKVAKYSFAVRSFFVAVSQSVYSLVVLLLVIGIVILLFGSMLYFVEVDVDPATRSDRCGGPCFSSIISASWSIVSAVTTAGYGDSYPKTAFGKVIVGGAAFVGVVVLALPIAVFEDNFNKVYRARAVCHRMVKILTRHQDVPIDVAVVEQWIETEIMHGRFERQAGISSAIKGFLGTGAAPSMKPVIARDAIARLDAAAMVANYDVQGRGYLVEGEALMMIADVNEHHAPEDTTKMNATLLRIADLLANSIERSLNAIEHRNVGHEYVAEQQKKLDDIWAPSPLNGDRHAKLQRSKTKKAIAWTPPELEKQGTKKKIMNGGHSEPPAEMDEAGWLEWTERLESISQDL